MGEWQGVPTVRLTEAPAFASVPGHPLTVSTHSQSAYLTGMEADNLKISVLLALLLR